MTAGDERGALEPRRYRFGHLAPGSALGGLEWRQLLVLIAGGAWFVLSLHLIGATAGAAVGLTGAASAAVVALVPLSGRTAAAWAPVLAAFGARRLMGRTRFRADAPWSGRTSGTPLRCVLPRHLDGVRVLAVPSPAGEVGVIGDRDGLVLVLSVDSHPFVLLDAADKERRVAGWGAVLAGLGRAGSPVERVQWIERTAAEPMNELGTYLRDHVDLPVSHRSVASYLTLVDAAAPVSREHEVLVALRVSHRRAGRLARRVGGGQDGLARVAIREATALAQQLTSLGVGVAGALSPRALAHAVRVGFDPETRASRDGVPVDMPGPTATDEAWGTYRADGSLHATYWMAEWPRTDVACDVLQQLILTPQVGRAVSVVMDPRDPARALREAEGARTQEAADEDLRERAGFLTSYRRRRQQEAIGERARELAEGHGAYRYAGFVTVSAATEEALEEACAAVEQSAQQSQCELRRLWGEQATGFAATLPLCRGIA